jgi:hypothetical protein
VEAPEVFADEGVACVGAGRDCGEGEALIELCGEIFEGVDGEVDAAGGEGVFDLFDEDAFCVERGAVFKGFGGGEGGVLHAIAYGSNDLNFYLMAECAKLGGDVVGLPQRELGAASSNAKN